MIALLFVLAVPLSVLAEPPPSKISALILENELDNSGGVCLLQREQGQVRSGGGRATGEEVTSFKALALQGDSVASKNATKPQLLLRKGQALSQSSRSSSRSSRSMSSSSSSGSSSGSSSSSSSTVHSFLAGSSVWQSMPLTAGVSEGMGIDYAAQALPQVTVVRSPRGKDDSGEPREKSKITLMVIEMFPLCWLFAVDRFYLGNIGMAIAKLSVSLGTCFIGGLIWGLVDFIAIIHNGLREEESLHALGMNAKFGKSQLHMGFVLAIVDLLMIPALLGLARFIWWWRKQQRMERLKEAAMRSPHYGIEPHQVKGG